MGKRLKDVHSVSLAMSLSPSNLSYLNSINSAEKVRIGRGEEATWCEFQDESIKVEWT